MSNLRNKSEINRIAADLLQDKTYYASVVHCAYYSCIQLVRHIIFRVIGKTENEFESDVRNSGKGSHEVMINCINSYLKSNNKDWKTFNVNIIQLKKLRVNADYENIQIDSLKGSNSISLSDIVLKHLKSNIKL